jgi:hypothetical protein
VRLNVGSLSWSLGGRIPRLGVLASSSTSLISLHLHLSRHLQLHSFLLIICKSPPLRARINMAKQTPEPAKNAPQKQKQKPAHPKLPRLKRPLSSPPLPFPFPPLSPGPQTKRQQIPKSKNAPSSTPQYPIRIPQPKKSSTSPRPHPSYPSSNASKNYFLRSRGEIPDPWISGRGTLMRF